MKFFSACDDAKIRIWDVPEDGLTETLTEPTSYLHGIVILHYNFFSNSCRRKY